jgi:serine/threonine protein kinase
MDRVKSREVVCRDNQLETPEGEMLYLMGETLSWKEDKTALLVCGTRKPDDARVVIKSLPLQNTLYDPWEEALTLQTASAVEGVIPLWECLHDADNLYLVMPFMEKGDMFSLVSEKALAEAQARHYLGQMVRVLLRLETETHLAHHDVSLENFLRDGQDNLVLIDFGISVWEKAERKRYLYYGKPCYIAPELVDHRRVHDVYAPDVWSLGVCFYSMLTARMLYETPSSKEFHQLEKGRASALLDRDRALSREAKWLLRRMLHPEPCRRPTLTEMVGLVEKETNHSFWDSVWCFNGGSRTTPQNDKTDAGC